MSYCNVCVCLLTGFVHLNHFCDKLVHVAKHNYEQSLSTLLWKTDKKFSLYRIYVNSNLASAQRQLECRKPSVYNVKVV